VSRGLRIGMYQCPSGDYFPFAGNHESHDAKFFVAVLTNVRPCFTPEMKWNL